MEKYLDKWILIEVDYYNCISWMWPHKGQREKKIFPFKIVQAIDGEGFDARCIESQQFNTGCGPTLPQNYFRFSPDGSLGVWYAKCGTPFLLEGYHEQFLTFIRKGGWEMKYRIPEMDECIVCMEYNSPMIRTDCCKRTDACLECFTKNRSNCVICRKIPPLFLEIINCNVIEVIFYISTRYPAPPKRQIEKLLLETKISEIKNMFKYNDNGYLPDYQEPHIKIGRKIIDNDQTLKELGKEKLILFVVRS